MFVASSFPARDVCEAIREIPIVDNMPRYARTYIHVENKRCLAKNGQPYKEAVR